MELRGLNEIVFNRVTRPDHLGRFETLHAAQNLALHIDRKARRHAIHIYLVGVDSFGFENNLMSVFILKFDDLILD